MMNLSAVAFTALAVVEQADRGSLGALFTPLTQPAVWTAVLYLGVLVSRGLFPGQLCPFPTGSVPYECSLITLPLHCGGRGCTVKSEPSTGTMWWEGPHYLGRMGNYRRGAKEADRT